MRSAAPRERSANASRRVSSSRPASSASARRTLAKRPRQDQCLHPCARAPCSLRTRPIKRKPTQSGEVASAVPLARPLKRPGDPATSPPAFVSFLSDPRRTASHLLPRILPRAACPRNQRATCATLRRPHQPARTSRPFARVTGRRTAADSLSIHARTAYKTLSLYSARAFLVRRELHESTADRSAHQSAATLLHQIPESHQQLSRHDDTMYQSPQQSGQWNPGMPPSSQPPQQQQQQPPPQQWSPQPPNGPYTTPRQQVSRAFLASTLLHFAKPASPFRWMRIPLFGSAPCSSFLHSQHTSSIHPHRPQP